MFLEVSSGLFGQNQSKDFLRIRNHQDQEKQKAHSILAQSVGSLANTLLRCFRKWQVKVSVFSNASVQLKKIK